MLGLRHFDALETMPPPGSDKDRNRHLRSKLPAGRKGLWRVERFEIERGLELLRMMRDGRGTVPGMYTRLVHDKRGIIMSDTDAEIGDHWELFDNARGRVLIHGLGLGIALSGVLAKRDVASVDVVEIDADVIKLVARHFVDDRLTIHHADCRRKRWPKSAKWHAVWHDIWDEICGDNLEEIDELKTKFAGRCRWQGAWAEGWIR